MFRHIIITGAGSGLGLALAKRYAAPGVTLGLIGRNEERLNRAAESCRQSGAQVVTATVDVREGFKLADWIEKFDEEYPVDLVIANAGVTYSLNNATPFEPRAAIRDIFDTNVAGVIDTVNPLLAHMRARGRGHAVVIGSLSGYRGIPLFPAYSASKAAVRTYYEAIRGPLRRDGVIISVASPSFVETPMTEKLRTSRWKQVQVDHAAEVIARGTARGRPVIAFPRLHLLGLLSLQWLPAGIADRILMMVFRR